MNDPLHLLPLKPLEFSILLALAEGEALHGYAIARRVADRAVGAIRLAPGNLYHVLDRMIGSGLIAPTDRRDPEDERRRYYALTAFGRSVAAVEAERLREVVRTADRLTLAPEGGRS